MAGLRRASAVFGALGLLLPLLAAGGAPLAAGQEPEFSDPISYDIAVRIESATSQLEVTCDIHLWVLAGSASWQRVYRVTRPSGALWRPVISVRYRGSPADYDRAQDR